MLFFLVQFKIVKLSNFLEVIRCIQVIPGNVRNVENVKMFAGMSARGGIVR